MQLDFIPRGRVPALVPLLDRRQRLECALWLVLWAAAFTTFWIWWLQPQHNIGILRYVLSSLVLLWMTLLPTYFLIVFMRARIPDSAVKVPPDWRVAMVVTKAPSEPFEVVQQTLMGALRQDYPHDTWLADEDPDADTTEWCRRNGVLLCTRRGVEGYFNPTWPRRARCKEGNLAYFYDHFGYARYDFVSQMDADHIPADGYLVEMLRPFTDPRVGYVSAPSICDKNARQSWAARSRLYAEGTLHGPMQAGYSNGLAPLCIGSHYAVRCAALQQVGGLGPELAEDHSTTLLFNAGGWRGVHAMNALASGDGPETFADLAVQEFQWSRSLMTILLKYTMTYAPSLPPRMKAQFLFCQIWYPAFSVIMLLGLLIPSYALVMDINFVGVTYPEFIIRFSGMAFVILAIIYWIKKNGWLRPVDARVLSWEGALFLFVRWPWAALGVLMAVRDQIFGTTAEFRVTPKGGKGDILPCKVVGIYAFLAIISIFPVIAYGDIRNAFGFYVFACLNGAIYAMITLAILINHWRESQRAEVKRRTVTQMMVMIPVLSLVLIAILFRGPVGIQAMLEGVERVENPVRVLQTVLRRHV